MVLSLRQCACVLLVVVTIQAAAAQLEPEPKCLSRFDYDEKMLMKLLKIYDAVEKFENKLASFDDKTVKLGERMSTMEDAKAGVDVTLVKLEEQIAAQGSANLNVSEILGEVEMKVEQNNLVLADITSKKLGENFIGFSASNPVFISVGDRRGFNTVLTNEGWAFKKDTGVFTCPKAGVYFFIMHLVKKRSSSVDIAGCRLHHNGAFVAGAYIDPEDSTADNGSYGVSNSVFVKLEDGDTVNFAGCTPDGSLDDQSSFSGFIVATA